MTMSSFIEESLIEIPLAIICFNRPEFFGVVASEYLNRNLESKRIIGKTVPCTINVSNILTSLLN